MDTLKFAVKIIRKDQLCDGIVEKKKHFPQVVIARVEMQGFPGTHSSPSAATGLMRSLLQIAAGVLYYCWDDPQTINGFPHIISNG